MIQYLSKYVFCHRVKVAVLIALSLTGCALGVVQPYLSRIFIDLLISKPDIKIILRFSILLMSIGLTSIAVSYVSRMFIAKFQTQIGFDVNFHLVRQSGLSLLYINDAFDIRDYMPKRVNDLSGGEKQKIAFLKAILKKTDVLVLDEPSPALDGNRVNISQKIILSYKQRTYCLFSDARHPF